MKFEENYFNNSTISNYRSYKDKKFHGLAADLAAPLRGKKVLDFGCATGGLTMALREEGIDAIGTDISYWAIDFGRDAYGASPTVLQHYNRQLLEESFDIVLFLDVLEHIETAELHAMMKRIAASEIIVRIPVAHIEGENFALQVSRNDKTHIQVHSESWWRGLFASFGFATAKVFNEENIYNSHGVFAALLRREK